LCDDQRRRKRKYHASELGYSEAWLETRRVNSRAVNFYLKHGYREIPGFGKYAGLPEAICMAKELAR
jgi:ribosomal protein S18 acetylase RimI-like enzyme